MRLASARARAAHSIPFAASVIQRAGLSLISPERQPDEPHVLDFANRIIGAQNGNDFSVHLRVLASRLISHDLNDLRDGAPVPSLRVEIVISWDDDRGLSSGEIHNTLNSLLGLSLPNVAGADQDIEGFVQGRQPAPL
jgi:hypothetical protein